MLDLHFCNSALGLRGTNRVKLLIVILLEYSALIQGGIGALAIVNLTGGFSRLIIRVGEAFVIIVAVNQPNICGCCGRGDNGRRRFLHCSLNGNGFGDVHYA